MSKQAPRPLDGITVVSLEHAIAAPFCTRQLADMGARVIKIERPGSGDFARGYDERVRGLSSHFVWTNRSKESLTLDLKREEAGGIMDRLLESADVLVQNLAPGAAARLGLSFEALHQKYPRLIVCDISGYGADGPYRDKKAYDLLIQSESGFLSVTGTKDDPVKAGCSIADIAAGMYAYSAILNALLLRQKTGQGSRLDVSMLESMVEWMGFPMYYAFDGGAPPVRAGAARVDLPLRAIPGGRRLHHHAGPAERARMAGVLRASAAPGRTGGGSALPVEFAAHREPRRPAGTDRGGLRRPFHRTGDATAGRRPDRERARQRHGGRVGAPPIAGPRPLEQGGQPRR